MLGNLTGMHLIVVLAIVLLLFGATKLPALSRSVGQSIKIFRGEVRDIRADSKSDATGESTTAASSRTTSDETFDDVFSSPSKNPPKA